MNGWHRFGRNTPRPTTSVATTTGKYQRQMFRRTSSSHVLQLQRETVERDGHYLTRLDQGLYGCCTECGDDIPIARLRALPFAVRCVDCEEACEADTARRRSQGRWPALFGEASLRLG